MNTKTKVILILSLIFITVIILFGGVIYYFQNKYAFIDFYKRLEARVSISAKANLDPDTLSIEHLRALREQHLEKLEQEKDFLIKIDKGSNIDTISRKNRFPLTFLNTLLKYGKANEKRKNTFFSGAKYTKDNKIYLVIVSAENYYVSHHLIFLRNVLIISVCFMILIITFASIYFSRSIFDPIKQITDKVKEISTENIHLRVDNKNHNTEITELINTFNDLLNRIETSFETQKNFISNASHELGTPLTAIMGEADVSLLKTRSTEEYKRSLQNILQQA
ncbi:MAG: HAMP domain-containing protein, partial [Alphaproteobacteria bacterium]|nr:HAMP domain-containing protein [Alphaproteobacteria bacterium]